MASNVAVTYNFVAGNPAVADDVDQNFADIVTWINTNAVHLDGTKAFTGAPSYAADPTSANELARKSYVDSVSGTPIGAITMFAGAAAPANYLFCRGQAISRSTYSALFAIVGTTYGAGDGVNTFNLPNMQTRVPAGLDATGSPDTAFDVLGETGGAKTHTLTTSEMPSHTHTGSTTTNGYHSHQYFDHPSEVSNYGWGDGASGRSSVSTTTGGAGDHSHSLSLSNTGGGAAHNNLQPYIVLNFIIRVL